MESAGAPMQTLAAPAVQDRNATLYPEHWLANIRQMLRDNQREAALRQMLNGAASDQDAQRKEVQALIQGLIAQIEAALGPAAKP